MSDVHGPLHGLKVIDLSRVLAGPVCTQILGDMGADIIKVERPLEGDDTRGWGPPYLKDATGTDTTESAYYLSANRNKRSIALDLRNEADLATLHDLLADADILVENFKVGSLAKLGLDYDTLKVRYPRLVYASITGFGQTGPLASEPGYDFIIQGMCGYMAAMGAPDGPPTKSAIAIVDYVTGLNAAIAILAALNSRTQTGKGQHVDVALLDSGLAMMTNLAQYTLTSGKAPPRVGNAHASIVPYNAFEAADGWIIVAVGNDHQFARFCDVIGQPALATDPRFVTNKMRVQNRAELTGMIASHIKTQAAATWVNALMAHDVPCGPVHTLPQALAEPQIAARNMVIHMQHTLAPTPIALIGSPYKFSDTPVTYRYAPPTLGQNTEDIRAQLKDKKS